MQERVRTEDVKRGGGGRGELRGRGGSNGLWRKKWGKTGRVLHCERGGGGRRARILERVLDGGRVSGGEREVEEGE